MVLHCSVTVYRVCRSVGDTVEDSEMTHTRNITLARNIPSRVAALTGGNANLPFTPLSYFYLSLLRTSLTFGKYAHLLAES